MTAGTKSTKSTEAEEEPKPPRSSATGKIISPETLAKLQDKVTEHNKAREKLKSDKRVTTVLDLKRKTERLVASGEITQTEADKLIINHINDTVEVNGVPTTKSSFNPYESTSEMTVRIGESDSDETFKEMVYRIDEYYVLVVGKIFFKGFNDSKEFFFGVKLMRTERGKSLDGEILANGKFKAHFNFSFGIRILAQLHAAIRCINNGASDNKLPTGDDLLEIAETLREPDGTIDLSHYAKKKYPRILIAFGSNQEYRYVIIIIRNKIVFHTYIHSIIIFHFIGCTPSRRGSKLLAGTASSRTR